MLVSTALDSCRSCILEFYEESLANGPLSSHKLGDRGEIHRMAS